MVQGCSCKNISNGKFHNREKFPNLWYVTLLMCLLFLCVCRPLQLSVLAGTRSVMNTTTSNWGNRERCKSPNLIQSGFHSTYYSSCKNSAQQTNNNFDEARYTYIAEMGIECVRVKITAIVHVTTVQRITFAW